MSAAGIGHREMAFARCVREFRIAFGWTQVRLAEEVRLRGVTLHPTAITRIESGQRRVSLDEAVALADALIISLSGLLQPQVSCEQFGVQRLKTALSQVQTIAAEALS